MFPTFGLLTLTIVSLWLTGGASAPAWRRHVWLVPLGAACVAALLTGILHPAGLAWIAALGGVAFAFSRLASGWPRALAGAGLLLLSAGLMTHALPGFANPLAIAPVRLTADALPYRLHLNFDKTLVGVFVLGFCHARATRTGEWRALVAAAAPVAATTILLLIGVALAAGYVRLAPKWPEQAPLWLWANLCLTCFAEEALFRGLIQAQLTRRWSQRRHGSWLALGVAAVLFGLAHAAGGATYVALSTVAGFGYGLAYQRSGGRIEASILTHFLLNAVHFVGFTYPALAHAA